MIVEIESFPKGEGSKPVRAFVHVPTVARLTPSRRHPGFVEVAQLDGFTALVRGTVDEVGAWLGVEVKRIPAPLKKKRRRKAKE